MNDTDTEGKIRCLECGKSFSFLALHLNWIHQMNTLEYRERWGIPRHVPLASVEQSRRCRENLLRLIHRGEIVPSEQLLLMEEGRKKAGAPPATTLQKKYRGKRPSLTGSGRIRPSSKKPMTRSGMRRYEE